MAGKIERPRGGEDRSLRVAALIQRVLASLLQREAQERGWGLVSITSVTLSPDLRHARVYVSALASGASSPIASMQRAVGRYRAHVARALGLRIAPHLMIVADDSLARAARINALLTGSPLAGSPSAGDGQPADPARS